MFESYLLLNDSIQTLLLNRYLDRVNLKLLIKVHELKITSLLKYDKERHSLVKVENQTIKFTLADIFL